MRLSQGAVIWRGALLAACGVVVALVVAEVTLKLTIWGGLHISYVATTQPFLDRVVAAPGHPALHSGDIVDLRRLRPEGRFLWRYYDTRFGNRISLPVIRHGKAIAVDIVAGRATYFGKPFFSLRSWPFWFGVAGYFWMTLFTALVAWRMPGNREARLLALWLLTTVSGTVLLYWRATTPALDDPLSVLGSVLGTASSAFLAAYLLLFPPVSRLRRTLAWLSYASVALACVIVVTGAIGLWTLTIDPAGALLSGKVSQIAYNLLPFLFPTLCAVVANAHSLGDRLAERALCRGLPRRTGNYFLPFARSQRAVSDCQRRVLHGAAGPHVCVGTAPSVGLRFRAQSCRHFRGRLGNRCRALYSLRVGRRRVAAAR
jgi:hypothetical protein